MALKISWIIDKLNYCLMGQKFAMFNISSKYINIYKAFETIKKKVVHLDLSLDSAAIVCLWALSRITGLALT